MEQLSISLFDSPVRSDAIASAVRPSIDSLLSKFNMAPLYVAVRPLTEKENKVGISICYSISPSIFASADSTASKARGAVICRIKDHLRVTYIEIPADRSRFYASVGDIVPIGANSAWSRIDLGPAPDLAVIAEAVCNDISAFLLAFPSDMACCGSYEKCSNAGFCVCDNQDLAIGCYYKKNLMQGKNFYRKTAEGSGEL